MRDAFREVARYAYDYIIVAGHMPSPIRKRGFGGEAPDVKRRGAKRPDSGLGGRR